MGLTNLTFFFFLIVSLFIYYLIPKKYSYISLFVSSIVFLFFNKLNLLNVIEVIVVFLTSYIGALLIDKSSKHKKKLLIATIFIILGELTILKYSNLFIMTANYLFKTNFNLVSFSAPIGLSYYSLMMIAYLVSVYYGELVIKNPIKVGTFMIYFPIVTSGPFIKYDTLKDNLDERVKFNINNILNGIIRMLWGIFKVLVISTRLNIFVTNVYTDLNAYNPVIILFTIFLYTFELYTNFSGSIDIVIGVSEMFGITLPENFKNPFASQTITEFWRVWHITLGDFLRTYIFYPLLKSTFMQNLTKKCKCLFGKKGKKVPVFISMFILWLIIGIWHGGEYKYILASGILQFVFIMIEDIFGLVNKKRNLPLHILAVCRTFTLFSLSMVFFRATSIGEGLNIIKHLFIFDGGFNLGFMSNLDYIIVGVSLLLLLIVDANFDKIKESINFSVELRVSLICIFTLVILLFGMYGLNFVASDFIYGNF